ncbi:MAG: transaldolase family protein [Synechococcaceae cyanobacterium]|jgi:transaldolase
MTLQLLLDSAEPEAWGRWLASGLFHGVTTNPTLLRRAGQPCTLPHLEGLAREAFSLGARELHLQTWGTDVTTATAHGLALARIDPSRVLVKVPVTLAGAETARRLIAEGVSVTFTACYSVHQVLIAAALGARYIAPYLGRIRDTGRNATAALVAMQDCLDGIDASTRLLVASLRAPEELATLAAAGLDCFTLSPAIAEALFAVPDTMAAAEEFERDSLP